MALANLAVGGIIIWLPVRNPELEAAFTGIAGPIPFFARGQANAWPPRLGDCLKSNLTTKTQQDWVADGILTEIKPRLEKGDS